MSIAFFDLDKTLIAKNSASLWIRKELREGTMGWWTFARAVAWILRYHLGSANVESAVRESIASLGGSAEDALRARSLEFFRQEVQGLVRPGARDALAAHRARGESVVLLTSSSSYMSEPVQQALALDDYICTRFAVGADGRFTGAPVEPLCFGPGKVVLARAFAEQRRVNLADCTFYSDSASDLPMLEAVGKPVVVHPDPRLLRVARKRGWPVVDWGG